MLGRWFSRGARGFDGDEAVELLSLVDNGTVSRAMREGIALWGAMYEGRAPWTDGGEVVSMRLAPIVAGEVARLATLELRSGVVAGEGGGARAAFLDAQYQPVVDRLRVWCEWAAAYGTVALKPYVDGGRLRVEAVRAGQFFPIAADADGGITGCVFADRRQEGERTFIRLERHALLSDGYRIDNRAYAQREDGRLVPAPLSACAAWAGLAPEVVLAGVSQPLFAMLHMPGANVTDPDSPLGASCYARAADLMREADRQFSRLLWEMESGERALYVDVRAFEGDETEPGRLPAKRFYRTMEVDPSADTLFEAWSPQLREGSQIEALNEILERVEDACALARGTLSKAPESASRGTRTATELKIMRQRTYALICDVQRAVRLAMERLLWAMDVWATVCGLCEAGDWQVTFDFDDSVATDRDAAFAERVKLVELGVMEPEALRAWYFGEEDA